MDRLVIEPNREPTATFLLPTVGYQEGTPSQSGPFAFVKQNRDAYYRATHLQAIEFQVARLVVQHLVGEAGEKSTAKVQASCGSSRDTSYFRRYWRFVRDYVSRKVDFRDVDRRELGLEKYADADG